MKVGKVEESHGRILALAEVGVKVSPLTDHRGGRRHWERNGYGKEDQMGRVFYDKDADLRVLAGKTVAIIGYGNQGRAQALNLRDSGMEVVVGGRRDASLEQAEADGFRTMTAAEAAAEGDVICLLVPDEVQQQVYRDEIAPGLEAGKALDFAHGYNVHYRLIASPEKVDVIMVAPRMIGVGVRQRYLAGKGVPAFVAVAQDGSGEAWAKTLALARGIGCTRAGALETTFAEETELDHFSEHFVWPAIFRVLVGSFEFLTGKGYQPEAVVSELWGSKEAAEILEQMAERGIFGQMSYHSQTSQYGTLTRTARALPPGVRECMEEALAEIRQGSFAREWESEQKAGYPVFSRLKEEALRHQVNEVERRVRKLMGG
jgi:ketol-acid reductoisomerase